MGQTWTKILIALRGGTHQAGEASMAHQALRILDQELFEADEQVGLGRSSLANLMAKSILAAREAGQTRDRLDSLTDTVRTALAGEREDLAMEVAVRIGKLELVLIEDTRIAQEYARSVDTLRHALEDNEEKLRGLKQQVEVVRTTDIVQQVHLHLSAPRRAPVPGLQIVADALDAIRQQQSEIAERLQAEDELCARDEDLEIRLRDAPVISERASASSVLARIRAASPVETL